MHIPGPIPRDSDSAGLRFEQALRLVLCSSQRAIPSLALGAWGFSFDFLISGGCPSCLAWGEGCGL